MTRSFLLPRHCDQGNFLEFDNSAKLIWGELRPIYFVDRANSSLSLTIQIIRDQLRWIFACTTNIVVGVDCLHTVTGVVLVSHRPDRTLNHGGRSLGYAVIEDLPAVDAAGMDARAAEALAGRKARRINSDYEAILSADADTRAGLFTATAQRIGTTPQNVEKDFWVLLDGRRAIQRPAEGPRLLFKGGTLLSKGFGLIRHFSEDIDVTVIRDAPIAWRAAVYGALEKMLGIALPVFDYQDLFEEISCYYWDGTSIDLPVPTASVKTGQAFGPGEPL